MHDGLSRDFLNSHSVPRAKETQRSAPTVAQRHHQTKFHSPSRCPAPLPHQAPSHPPPGDRREGTNKTCLFFFSFFFYEKLFWNPSRKQRRKNHYRYLHRGLVFSFLFKKEKQPTNIQQIIYIYLYGQGIEFNSRRIYRRLQPTRTIHFRRRNY